MFQANLPSRFWADSILAATFLINRLPTAVLSWKSPFEVLFWKKLDYDRLKCFGCLSFASNTLPYKDKFDVMAFKCIFLGYAIGQKAYRVFDLENKKIFSTRDAVFYEDVFPF